MLHRTVLDGAKAAGVDVLADISHSCHRELVGYEAGLSLCNAEFHQPHQRGYGHHSRASTSVWCCTVIWSTVLAKTGPYIAHRD